MVKSKPSPLMVGLCAMALIQVLQLMDQYVTNAAQRSAVLTQAYENYLNGGSIDQLLNAAQAVDLTVMQSILSILLGLMALMISVGVVIYSVCVIRFRKGSYGNLFDGLPMMLRVVWYQILTGIYTGLWTLLFVFPGIMAMYSYRMGLYILLDHPELTVNQCIKASKKMMKGNRWELFVIDLSFLGWNMGVSMITAGAAMSGMGYVGLILALPLAAYVAIYMQFTDFLYFEHLRGVYYDPNVLPEEPKPNE